MGEMTQTPPMSKRIALGGGEGGGEVVGGIWETVGVCVSVVFLGVRAGVESVSL